MWGRVTDEMKDKLFGSKHMQSLLSSHIHCGIFPKHPECLGMILFLGVQIWQRTRRLKLQRLLKKRLNFILELHKYTDAQ